MKWLWRAFRLALVPLIVLVAGPFGLAGLGALMVDWVWNGANDDSAGNG